VEKAETVSGLPYAGYLSYLREIEGELLRIGSTKCNKLRDESQLSAVIFLLIRGVSLFRSVLLLLSLSSLDACDAVRRAYLETWLLAFEVQTRRIEAKDASLAPSAA
jgi:hypothetical protein